MSHLGIFSLNLLPLGWIHPGIFDLKIDLLTWLKVSKSVRSNTSFYILCCNYSWSSQPHSPCISIYICLSTQQLRYQKYASQECRTISFNYALYSKHYICSRNMLYKQWTHEKIGLEEIRNEEWLIGIINSKSVQKLQPHKVVKHTQTIRRQFADELFECVWLFCGIGA